MPISRCKVLISRGVSITLTPATDTVLHLPTYSRWLWCIVSPDRMSMSRAQTVCETEKQPVKLASVSNMVVVQRSALVQGREIALDDSKQGRLVLKFFCGAVRMEPPEPASQNGKGDQEGDL